MLLSLAVGLLPADMGMLSQISAMAPGVRRRAALLAWFQMGAKAVQELPVNNKWQFRSQDPDLAYMLKRGLLRQTRNSAGKGRKSQSYLVLTDKAPPRSKTFEVSGAEMLRVLTQSKGKLYRWALGHYCATPQPVGTRLTAVPRKPWISSETYQYLVDSKQLTLDGEVLGSPVTTMKETQ